MEKFTLGRATSHLYAKLAKTFIIACLLICEANAYAQLPPGFKGPPTNTPIASWSFHDPTNWLSDQHRAPLSFTNLASSWLGNGDSLVVDTNIPAWLTYNAVETDGTTNLTVDNGTIMFWFAPNWSSTNDVDGGSGPGVWGRLFEVGSYTDNASYGWWSIFVDEGGNNIYFAGQTNDLSSTITTYLSAPIDWTTNYFHFIAVTYSPTNTALYLDGEFVTNGAPMTIYPGPEVLANGFEIGSDTNGLLQAHGLFNSVKAFNYPLSSNIVESLFDWDFNYYMMDPFNTVMNIASAPSSPSLLTNSYDIITGQGSLQSLGSAATCSSGTNISQVWLTNITATVVHSGTNYSTTVTFDIEGGLPNVPYDVFANSVLDFSATTNFPWAWMGQGYQCNKYSITNLPINRCFIILGTPQDTDFDGLTDAYERLVAKTNPNNADSDGDGISDSDEILNGTDPLTAISGWKLDTDNDGLPDTYENAVGLIFNFAEAAPGLPTYSKTPLP